MQKPYPLVHVFPGRDISKMISKSQARYLMIPTILYEVFEEIFSSTSVDITFAAKQVRPLSLSSKEFVIEIMITKLLNSTMRNS